MNTSTNGTLFNTEEWYQSICCASQNTETVIQMFQQPADAFISEWLTDGGSRRLPKRLNYCTNFSNYTAWTHCLNYCFSVLASTMNQSIWVYSATVCIDLKGDVCLSSSMVCLFYPRYKFLYNYYLCHAETHLLTPSSCWITALASSSFGCWW